MHRKLIVPLTVALLLALLSGVVQASSATVVVTEADITRQAEGTPPTDSWVGYTRAGTPPTSIQFIAGPSAPPSGVGSLQLSTATGAEKAFLFNYDYVGTPLPALSAISYQTYRSAGSAQQVAALNVQIDYNGAAAGGFATLVFEPVYNTAQGPVVSGEWQSWQAGGDGIWWSTQPINGQCAGATASCDKSWSEIVANNPDAVILAIGINQGSGNPGLVTSVDALALTFDGESVTYDFEPYRVAQSADDCKDGGWQEVRRADGSSFKNQGDCIQYVNTGS